jgi:class 3 adenylate cyclase
MNMTEFSSLPIFVGVSPERLMLLKPAMVHFYNNGQAIICEKLCADCLVVLIRGEAKVVADGTYLVTRSAGSIIGEQALIEGVPRTATVAAQGTVEALVIPKTVFESLLLDANFARNLMRALSAKLSEATSSRASRFRNEERLFAEFSAHLAPEVADRLLVSGERYGEPRYIDAVILMADVRSFTATSGKMSPAEIACQLSPYLDAMVEIIHRHQGFVDKFIGDAVLAVWGVTHIEGNDASKAFACARQMVTQAATMKFGGRPIRIGVGLNKGKVFVGNVGRTGKRQFTVLGTPVNLAQRYESKTKELEADVVAGAPFHSALLKSDQSGWAKQSAMVKGAPRQNIYSFVITGRNQNVRAQTRSKGRTR